jgi:hypothetical protein
MPRLQLSYAPQVKEKAAVAAPAGTRSLLVIPVSHCRVRDSTLMARERRHYPWTIYLLTVICGLGLACVAIGIADGWVFIAAGVAAIAVSLARLHVVLDRRRVRPGLRPLPLAAGSTG